MTVNKPLVLACAAATCSLIMLDTNIVAVALPTIGRQLHAGFVGLQWVISAYLITFASLLLPSGTLADRFGRRRMVMIGIALFLVSSATCGLAPSALVLELSRAIQGIGASMLLTSALAIISSTFRGPERARAYAIWGTSIGAAMTCGPILGGIITGLFGWRWAFLINVPLCIVFLVAIRAFVPESSDPEKRRLDLAGVLALSTSLFLLVWTLIDGNREGWLSAQILARLSGAVLLLIAFVVVERIQAQPMLDLKLLTRQRYLGAATAMFGYGAAAQVMIFFLPLYLQNWMHLAPIAAGFAMLPFALPLVTTPPLAARFLEPLTHRSRLLIGLGIAAIGDLLLGLSAHAGASYLVMIAAMLVAGTGTGLLNPETARAMQAEVPAERAGMASGIGATIRFVSLVIGVAVLGAVFHLGFAVSAFVAVGIALVASVGTVVLLRQEGWVQAEHSREDAHGTRRSWAPAPHRS
ncbi:MAG TPA: MFS transporter [Candidatus Acidoferrales bacterium]|nr:MFS transporter [Candidatus Acidoferrales bacterium]